MTRCICSTGSWRWCGETADRRWLLPSARRCAQRTDIQKILIIGSGPIVIGQAAEFDYSGVQACKVLLEEGYEVVLVNSNPATIMTDPEFATATYVEPLTLESVAAVIEKERPDALLGTLGGQTALNLARGLYEEGVLDRFGVSLIGVDYDAIGRAEDRQLFRETVLGAGLRVPRSAIVTSIADAERAIDEIGFPAIVRPAFTLGGHGGGIAHDQAEFHERVSEGLNASPINQVLLEQSLIGWGEFELEVMRDHNDNALIVCSIENIDPMGVHTGDSVTVAPQQTLSDRQYQVLRDQALTVIRAVGVETGGSNIQFAVSPDGEEVLVIEMNPRVSRSSALASKATGFPIAKIAARLAVGYALEEIPNDITRRTPASFEPTIDYAVVKIPRFAFEKFPFADGGLTTQMKSVGEVMAIGRTFKQAFMKAMRARELDAAPRPPADTDELLERLERPSDDRYDLLLEALRRGAGVDDLHRRTNVHPWFLSSSARWWRGRGSGADRPALARKKELGLSDRQAGVTRFERLEAGLRPEFKSVDTCAAEFEAETPYFYSAYEGADGERGRAAGDASRSVVILGSGPNRIGQGIEFDYCCVHAAMTVRELGRDAVMVNCNPETVSTDYDTSDRLYFEPLTVEDVMEVIDAEQPEGVIVQFGGQTPLRIAASLRDAGVKLLGTPVDAIDLAEDRERFGGAARGARHPGAALRDRPRRGRGARRRQPGRLPAAGPPVVRARRPRDGALLFAGRPGVLRRAPRRQRERRADRAYVSAAARPLPRERDRARCRCSLRRRGRLRRGHHAARRRGRGALGRLRLRAATAEPRRGDAGAGAQPDPRAGAAARRDRPPERAVRAGGERAPVRDRGEPARLANGAVRLEGDRSSPGEGGLPPDPRRAAARPGPSDASRRART